MKIGIVDIETTGFLGQGASIVEIGIAGLDTRTGEINKLFHSLCREDGFSEKDSVAWIFQNSDLTMEAVLEAPTLDEIKDGIQAVLHSTDANTAYNKKFDFDFLRSRGFDIGRELPCPMLLSTPICKCPPFRYGTYKWPKVEEAWRFYFPDAPYMEAHRGLDDALHEARIVFELFRRGLMPAEIGGAQ